jgi:hypothetical protein
MPNSAMKGSPTVSAHAILSRRRRRHDIILINFAIFSHRSLDREGSSLRVKRKAPHPPPGAGRNHALCAYEPRGETVLGPASIWTSIHRMGETLWLHACAQQEPSRRLGGRSAVDRFGGYYRRQVGGANVSAFANEAWR